MEDNTLNTENFIHLKIRTDYSLCKSTISYKRIVKKAKSLGIKTLGSCDDENLFGSLEFADECVKNGIKPIIGCNVSITDGHKTGPLTIISRNEEGYKNLLYLSSIIKLDESLNGGITLDILSDKSAGLIVLSGGIHGIISQYLLEENHSAATNFSQILQGYFGDMFCIELTRHGTPQENNIQKQVVDLALQLNIPLAAVNDVYFLEESEYEAADVLLCVGNGNYQFDKDRARYSPHQYFKSPNQMVELFDDIQNATANTVEIAKLCNYWPKGRDPMLPPFKTDSGLPESEELKKQSFQGLEERLADCGIAEGYTIEDYKNRLEFELEVINKMGFAGYFLIVSDFIKWSKQNGVAVGPGRGSGAGSIVAWVLYITDLDPIFYGLLFERFLNPDRVSMPDFDIDFCQENRHRTIEYVQQKYGKDNVAAIITFGKLQARAVLKDVGRVLQMPYSVVDRISKMVPFNPVDPVTLEKAIELDAELQKQREVDPDIAKLLDIGLQLEGLSRHSSTHAAGIIIGDKPLIEIVPLSKEPSDTLPVVGYNMKAAEKAGLVKFDFLGLKTLTIITNACKLILERHDIKIDINKIPMSDEKTFTLLQKGFTRGVFQLDSVVCKDSMRQMKISDIKEIIALTSLNRPGPMENIPSYIARKIGKEEVIYPHDTLKDVLAETFGIIIYQEQVMQVAQVLAGYSLGQADLLRRAMGKKIKEEMEQQRKIFVDGSVANGIDAGKAGEIFDLVEKFAGYGFNKSHAAAYSVISYQTAYLKAHYPTEFFTACLNISLGDTDDLNLFINEARSMGVKLKSPDINISQAGFSIDKDGNILYALGALKAVGYGAIDEMVKIRQAEGSFKNLFDYLLRLGNKIANKRSLESLAKSGAFDGLYSNRKELVTNVDKLTAYASTKEDTATNSIEDLFGNVSTPQLPKLQSSQDYQGIERLLAEFEAVGFYLSSHPLEEYKLFLKAQKVISSEEIEDLTANTTKELKVKMAGVISVIKQRTGKKGRFAFLNISDLGGMYETSIFNDKLINNKRDLIKEGRLVYIEVAIQKQEGGTARIIINEMHDLQDFIKNPSIASKYVTTSPTDQAKQSGSNPSKPWQNKENTYNSKETNKPKSPETTLKPTISEIKIIQGYKSVVFEIKRLEGLSKVQGFLDTKSLGTVFLIFIFKNHRIGISSGYNLSETDLNYVSSAVG